MRKRLLTAILVGASLSGMAWSSSLAKECAASFCVDATQTTNGTTGLVTIALGNNASVAGKVVFNCWLGPIPFICDMYLVQGIAYTPFSRPAVVAGNLPIKSYTTGTNPNTGQFSWLYNYSETNSGDRTLYLTGRAKSDTRSSGYWISTGTGTGHLTDDFYRQSVTVK
jgi:hypothetical protein